MDLRIFWCGVGQIESDGIFVFGVKAQEPMITGSLVLVFLFQWDNKNHDFIKICSLMTRLCNFIQKEQISPLFSNSRGSPIIILLETISLEDFRAMSANMRHIQVFQVQMRMTQNLTISALQQ